MSHRSRQLAKIVCGLLALATLLACDLTQLISMNPGKPEVSIGAPPHGAEVALKTEVLVQAEATDDTGVSRIELWEDGTIVAIAQSPTPQPRFSAVLRWTPSSAGPHTLIAKAVNAASVTSDPAAITVHVIAPTPLPPTATPTKAPTVPATLAPSPAPTTASTPAASPTPRLASGVLFSDDFTSKEVSAANGWSFATGDNVDYVWSPSYLTFTIKRVNWLGFTWPIGEFDNFAAEAEGQPLADADLEYGLVLRGSGKSTDAGSASYYLFGITSGGNYHVFKKVAGNWAEPDPVSDTASPQIKRETSKNILGVIAQGNTFSLYINRTLVKTFTDNTLTNGYVGLYAGTGKSNRAQVQFERFTLSTPAKAKADWETAPGNTAKPLSKLVPGSILFGTMLGAGNKPSNAAATLPYGWGKLFAYWSYSGATPGAPFSYEWLYNGKPLASGNSVFIDDTDYEVQSVGSGSQPLAAGTYQYTLRQDGQRIASGQVVIQPPVPSNTLSIYFTIQNLNPTGYVIDKQGGIHSPPGFLTISGIHVNPGDRVLLYTDAPRFSLLFDCSTWPQAFAPCDFTADTPAKLPREIQVRQGSLKGYFNISRGDNWAGVRPNFPSQRYPADPVLRIVLGD